MPRPQSLLLHLVGTCLLLVPSPCSATTSKQDPKALLRAVQHNDLDKVQALVNANPQPNLNLPYGNKKGTLLHYAAYNVNLPITRTLLNAGANPNTPQQNGETPLYTAIRTRRKDLIKLFLEYGAHINTPNQDGETPLYWAVRIGRKDIVRLLLRHNADVHVQDHEGRTPLHLATWYSKIPIMRLLLKKGAPINIQNHAGETPLHTAVLGTLRAQISTVQYLLRKGADTSIRNARFKTPYDIAKSTRQKPIAHLLTHPPTHHPSDTSDTSDTSEEDIPTPLPTHNPSHPPQPFEKKTPPLPTPHNHVQQPPHTTFSQPTHTAPSSNNLQGPLFLIIFLGTTQCLRLYHKKRPPQVRHRIRNPHATQPIPTQA